MSDTQKLDALIDQKGKIQDDIYRAEQAVQEDGEMPAVRARPTDANREKLQILQEARARLAAIDAEIKAYLEGHKP